MYLAKLIIPHFIWSNMSSFLVRFILLILPSNEQAINLKSMRLLCYFGATLANKILDNKMLIHFAKKFLQKPIYPLILTTQKKLTMAAAQESSNHAR